MARRDEMLDLLRPPAHRGPLIAAGAVLFTLGIALEEQRLDDTLPNGIHVLILALAAGLMLGLGLQAELEDGRPAAYQSVLLVCGLLLLGGTLLELAHALGGDYPWSAPTLTWTSLLLAAAAAYAAWICHSAICGMIAAIALGAAFLALIDWLFGPTGQNGYRWLLLLISLVAVLASLALRGSRPRQAELLVIVAGLATLGIAGLAVTNVLVSVFGIGTDATLLPGWWEFVVLVSGCGLIAYGSVDGVPGAAWLGVAHLAAFLAAASAGADDTLMWWPLVLLLLGGGVMATGLRPRVPLPPEPDGYSVERPLASRSDDDEVTVRVRVDDR